MRVLHARWAAELHAFPRSPFRRHPDGWVLASVVAPDTDQPLTDAIHLDHPGRAYAQVDGAGRVRVDVASDGDLDWRLTVREWVAGRYHPLDAQAGSQAEFPQWLLGPVGCGETAGEADED